MTAFQIGRASYLASPTNAARLRYARCGTCQKRAPTSPILSTSLWSGGREVNDRFPDRQSFVLGVAHERREIALREVRDVPEARAHLPNPFNVFMVGRPRSE